MNKIAVGNATITIASCPGDTLSGTQSGSTISIPQTTTFTCSQTDANGDQIAITSIGGTLTLDSGDLDVSLTETRPSTVTPAPARPAAS